MHFIYFKYLLGLIFDLINKRRQTNNNLLRTLCYKVTVETKKLL